MSENKFIMPTTTATGPSSSTSIYVEEFDRDVEPRVSKAHWPQRHPITCALHHFPEGYPFKCVELGVYEGDHSLEMLKVLDPEQLYLVDMWVDIKISGEGSDYIHDTQEMWDRRYLGVQERYAPYDNVSVLRMSTDQAAQELPDDLDLVYIDANHDYAPLLNDMNKWFPKVRQGGILSGDDYCREEVERAVADFLKDYPQYTLQVSNNNTQWWFIKEATR